VKPFYLLDTDLCVALIRTPLVEETPCWRAVDASRCLVSAITAAELEVGANKAANKVRERLMVDELLARFQVVPFDREAAGHYGDIRAELEKKGASIGPLDLLIAGHARSLGAMLITANTREFRRVPGLKCLDWTME